MGAPPVLSSNCFLVRHVFFLYTYVPPDPRTLQLVLSPKLASVRSAGTSVRHSDLKSPLGPCAIPLSL
jgi:hypothetical protein